MEIYVILILIFGIILSLKHNYRDSARGLFLISFALIILNNQLNLETTVKTVIDFILLLMNLILLISITVKEEKK